MTGDNERTADDKDGQWEGLSVTGEGEGEEAQLQNGAPGQYINKCLHE